MSKLKKFDLSCRNQRYREKFYPFWKNNENCNFKFGIWHNTLLKETTDSISALEMTKLRKKVGSVKKMDFGRRYHWCRRRIVDSIGKPRKHGLLYRL